MRRLAPIGFVLFLALSGTVRAALTPEEQARTRALLAKLGDENYKARQQATEELVAMGYPVAGLVSETLARTRDAEVRMRCEWVLASLRFNERRVLDLGPAPPQRDDAMRSWSGEDLFFVRRRDGKMTLVHNGVEGPLYDVVYRPTFHWRAGRIAYPARSDGKGRIVCDGREGPLYDRADFIRISPDGKRVAYVARADGKAFVVVDGEELTRYDGIIGIRFSDDGRHVFYAGRRGDRQMMVVDRSEGPEHEQIYTYGSAKGPQYLFRTDRTLYLAELAVPAAGPMPEKLALVVRRPMATLPADLIGKGVYLHRSSGDHLLFTRNRDWIVFHRGVERGRYNSPPNYVFSPDGKRMAFTAKRDAKRFLLIDGVETGGYAQVTNMTFSPDGNRLAYSVQRLDQTHHVVVDSRTVCEGYFVGSPALFSPDSKHVVCKGRKNDADTLFIDGEAAATYSRIGGSQSGGHPLFSPDGRHLAWVASTGPGEFLVCDGRPGPPYDMFRFTGFSPDSRHLYCVVTTGVKEGNRLLMKSFVLLDGIAGPLHDEVIPLNISDPKVKGLRYAVNDDGRQSLIETDWPADLDWTNGLKPLGGKAEK